MLKKTKQNSGQGLTEYLMILMLISVVAIGATSSVGQIIERKLEKVRQQINDRVTVNGQ